MDRLGEYLKRERKLRGISLREVSDFTKVPVNLLRAIEDDDYDSLPHPTYVRGFIRAYCKCLGLDENDAILQYEEILRAREESGVKAEETKTPLPQHRSTEWTVAERRRIALVVSLFVIGVMIVLFSFIFMNRYDTQDGGPSGDVKEGESIVETVDEGVTGMATFQPPLESEKLSEETVEEEPTSPETMAVAGEGDEVGDKPQEEPQKGHILVINAIERTWIKASIDDKEPFEVLLKEGEKVSWEAEKGFLLLIGNAGGVNLVLDGREMGVPGESGEVLTLKLPSEKE